MDKDFWSVKWWLGFWPRLYKFMIEPNDFELSNAKRTLACIDAGFRRAIRYGLWLAIFIIGIDFLLLVGSIATTPAGFRVYEPMLFNDRLLLYIVAAIVFCLVWRLVAICCGALLRLVELREPTSK